MLGVTLGGVVWNLINSRHPSFSFPFALQRQIQVGVFLTPRTSKKLKKKGGGGECQGVHANALDLCT